MRTSSLVKTSSSAPFGTITSSIRGRNIDELQYFLSITNKPCSTQPATLLTQGIQFSTFPMVRDSQISNALRITDVNDFLAPSTNCILPLNGGATLDTSQNDIRRIQNPPPGSVLTPIMPVGASQSATPKAKVTVSDCLSCSGCVTSAETILLSSESKNAFKSAMKRTRQGEQTTYKVVAFSQQSIASIAVREGLSLTTTARKLATFMQKEADFDAVLDLSEMRHISLLEASKEFLQRYKSGHSLTITSACPGWLTYAEKTQNETVLECVSTIRSSQAMLGSIAPRLLPVGDNRTLWISVIMPCHDKKIEAARPEFITSKNTESPRREVDCVLTTEELTDIIIEFDYNLRDAPESELTYMFDRRKGEQFGVNVGSESGGYADFILRQASRELLNKELPNEPLITQKASKSGDVKNVIISNTDGTKSLSFATAYGFRSLQSILRKIRRGECTYNYIELMACPGGCTNGGGQLSLPEDESGSDPRTMKQIANSHLNKVNNVYFDAPECEDPNSIEGIKELYRTEFGDEVGEGNRKQKVTIQLESRKTSSTMASLAW